MRKPPALPSATEPRDATSFPESITRVLTVEDHATLAHLLRRGIGENSLRATRSDLGYLEAWSFACDGEPLVWPPSKEIVLRFIAHHLWDPDQREIDTNHGMPSFVQEALIRSRYLRVEGPHAPSTVQRRISTWRSLCKWRGVEHPFSTPEVSKTLRAAIRASTRHKRKKSKRMVDIALIEELLDHLDLQIDSAESDNAEVAAQRLQAYRDRALLAVMFASGGRRRSEISDLMWGQVYELEPIITEDSEHPNGIPSMGLYLGRTKTTDVGEMATVFLSGRAVTALTDWQAAVSKSSGPVFRRISRWGHVYDTSISAHSVNAVLKKRLAEIGLDPADFSAHGVRAGYITSALKAGIPAPEVMEQTLHRSLETLMGYFSDEQQRKGRAARLL
jgi:integrase